LVEAAERMRVRSDWVLAGAIDWVRSVLRDDASGGGVDHLGEAWSKPVHETRVSALLASGSSSADSDDETLLLSFRIFDLQARLNATNLVEAGRISEPALRSFTRLFDLLGLPREQLQQMAERLRQANDAQRDALAPLAPQSVEQLAWLGMPPDAVMALQPYVAVLPTRTPVNLNTAGAEVLYAAVDGISLEQARRLVAQRESSPFAAPAEAATWLDRPDGLGDSLVGVGSSYFEVRSRVRVDSEMVEERAVLKRTLFDVQVLSRARGAAEPAGPVLAASGAR